MFEIKEIVVFFAGALTIALVLGDFLRQRRPRALKVIVKTKDYPFGK